MSPAPHSNDSLPLSAKARRTREAPISFLMEAVIANPALINFAAGLVDAPSLPVEPTRRIAETILSDDPRARVALQYDTTLGLRALRQRVIEHVEALEGKPAASMSISADNVLVTTGSQQALYLIADVLVDPGDIVITANPSYFVFAGALESLGAEIRTVPMDDHGMVVEEVETLLQRLERQNLLPRVKFIYCTSYYQNPTGLTLSEARRPRLLEIARKHSRYHRLLILEDAAYRELRYDGPALPSIKSFDAYNRHTVLAQTFSKPFAPGIKTGYTIMPDDLLEACAHQKGNHDFGSANLCQQIALQAMNDGSYTRHVELLQQAYRRKRDTLLKALDRHMPRAAGLHWTIPNGGLYVWLTLPESIDTSRDGGMFQAALAAGVIYVPGEYCYQPDTHGARPRNHLRLSFGQVDEKQIEPGIERLASVVREQLRQHAPHITLAATKPEPSEVAP